MENDYNSLYNEQLRTVYVMEYRISNPYASIRSRVEVQKNGKLICTTKWRYVGGNKSSAKEEENDEKTIGIEKDKSSLRIFYMYKNITVLGEESGRSASNRLGNSAFWKSQAESPIQMLLLTGNSLRTNEGEKIETYSANSTFNNQTLWNERRDEINTNVSSEYETNSSMNFEIRVKEREGTSCVVFSNKRGRDRISYRYDPNTLNQKIKTNFSSCDKNFEIFPRNSDNAELRDEVRSKHFYENMKPDYFPVNCNLEIFNKNLTNYKDDDNVYSENNIRNLLNCYRLTDGNSKITNKNTTLDDTGSNLTSENNRRGLIQNCGIKLHASLNSTCSTDNPDTYIYNANSDNDFDGVDFFCNPYDMAFEKPDITSLAIFIILLKRLAIIIEHYVECNTNDDENLKRNGRKRIRLSIVPSDVFEEAMRQCHIETLELAYSFIFPSDCRMFVGVPIYRNGFIHRKDQL